MDTSALGKTTEHAQPYNGESTASHAITHARARARTTERPTERPTYRHTDISTMVAQRSCVSEPIKQAIDIH